MANPENLKPQAHVLTVEEASRGGTKSAESRRKRKSMREDLNLLLSMPLCEEMKKLIEDVGIEGEMDNQAGMLAAMFKAAMNGDVKAFDALRDIIGEKGIKRDTAEEKRVEVIDDLPDDKD